ncbi:hypothetical protein N0V88_003320 [Collariella sp. IMI 366227]|nr:hypothetical protein N0V88_003320 [Collariella sp. IMI 366227]
MASQERSMPFIKNLASSDRKIRTAALTSLTSFLSARHVSSSLTTLDMLKLWKGLFYALWMRMWPFALEEEARIEDIAEEKGGQIQQKIPAGLRLHVLDIWVDEAEKAGLLDEEDKQAQEILERISDQIDTLEGATTSPAVRVRAKESLADERLPGNRIPKGEEEEEGEGEAQGDGDWDGFDD